MNNAVLGGVIASTPQIRYTEQGKAIADFKLEFPNPSKSESAKQIKVVGFGKLAETIAQFKEGESVIVTGQINIESREVNGTKTRFTEFVANAIQVTAHPVGINHVSLAGRTGKDPDVKYFESGTNKTSLSLASRRGRDATNWFDLELWGKVGEIAGNFVRKGGLIGVIGQLKFEEWTDRNSGELRSKPVINVGQLELLGGKREQEEDVF